MAEFLGIKETSVANMLTRLKVDGFIKVEGYGSKRRLFVTVSQKSESDSEVSQKSERVSQKSERVSQKNESPIYRINNTENNTVVIETTTAENALVLYRKYYPNVPLHLFNQEQLVATEHHLDVFDEVLKIWVGRQYREQNIKGMLSLYERLLLDKKSAEVKLFCEKCEVNSGWLPQGEAWIRCKH